jgi:hypothetical protein
MNWHLSPEALVELLWCPSCEEHVETNHGECVQCDAVLDPDAFRDWWWSDQRGWSAAFARGAEPYPIWKE